MAEVALEREAARERRQFFLLRFYRDNTGAARALLSFIVVGALWELFGRLGVWPLVMAPLTKIFESAAKLWVAGQLQRHILISLNEFVWGYALAAALGIGLGLLIATNDVVRDFVDPWISAIYATPTVALAPLFIIVFLLAFFPIVINVSTGVRATDRVFIEAAHSFCASRGQIFLKVLLPSALPFIVAGLRLGIGRGLIGVVVGELFGARGGLGYLVFTSSQLFDTAGLWVGVFILAGTGILSVVVLQKVERRLAPWREFEFK
jgi:ABC-type nitrate/sulfonate/bicarbonate transport system permease component